MKIKMPSWRRCTVGLAKSKVVNGQIPYLWITTITSITAYPEGSMLYIHRRWSPPNDDYTYAETYEILGPDGQHVHATSEVLSSWTEEIT